MEHMDISSKHAVDCVQEPFSEERIGEAMDAAFRKTAGERAATMIEMLPQLQQVAQRQPARIAIKTGGRILFIDPGDVISAHAEGNYTLLQRESGSYLLRESISTLAEKLKPYGFIRIHRSVLVNTSFVVEIRPRSTGEYELLLIGGKEYTVTRTYKNTLIALAELWLGMDKLFAG